MIDLTVLRRVPLFRDFEEAELAQIASVVAIQRFGKHHFIVRESELGDAFFIIIKGSTAVCRVAPDGRETILSILKEGEFFGEMTKIGRLLVIELAERLRAANAIIASTTSQDIRARLATLLLSLSDKFGEPVPSGIKIALRLTNQEMASMIGTTRETVNRTLNRFWDDQLVDMRTAYVVVTSPDKLRALIP
jgi:CRP/FNR family transcriptional regulator